MSECDAIVGEGRCEGTKFERFALRSPRGRMSLSLRTDVIEWVRPVVLGSGIRLVELWCLSLIEFFVLDVIDLCMCI